ncbi:MULTISPECIES: hypothetical protein [Streptomyces]|uniref:DUF8129 domain-containing protein n=1 Tax=Streptomyces lycii TaxID=2654337 RepID=A0ABQ7FJA0_9ACTN|nr:MULTISPECIES: hypothetical protein [Streptomyces]KAF4407871.1 hypothetical protein GCU69_17420 [Streptomyces lycii]PGH50985.1 hypothetical protein CRI70_09080 [Streptomyces sp. Ru87]
MSHHHGDDLPLPDYDQLSAGTLEHRLHTLDSAELETLRHYEQEHANRAPVLTLITSRLRQLEEGSTPSPGGSDLHQTPRSSAGGSPVSPATSPEPIHPPPHGTDDQRGKPKGNRP